MQEQEKFFANGKIKILWEISLLFILLRISRVTDEQTLDVWI